MIEKLAIAARGKHQLDRQLTKLLRPLANVEK